MSTMAQSQETGQDEETDGVRAEAVIASKELAHRDPLVRQRAAEKLAKIVATDQQKLIEGYRLQEKNARVRLALDWALYRLGKKEALFSIIRDLDSSRAHQAFAYLTELESPEPLYMFLTRTNGNTQVKLLHVFALIGDSETVDRIKPYTTSLDPLIAQAAQFATREITRRLTQSPIDTPQRPRRVETPEKE